MPVDREIVVSVEAITHTFEASIKRANEAISGLSVQITGLGRAMVDLNLRSANTGKIINGMAV